MEADGLSAGRSRAIVAAVEAYMAANKIPAAGVAVVADGRIVFERGFGFADLEARSPATADTVFRLASVSKPIAAVAVLRLAEQGKLDLDAPVQRYVPSFPDKGRAVTCRQLLCHAGGIRHYKPGEIDSTRRYPTLARALEIFRDDPLVAGAGGAGGGFEYSTYGYTLLGAAAESATGESFMNLLRPTVLEPAGMTRTRDDSVSAVVPGRARGYELTRGGELVNAPPFDASYKIPGGGIVATAGDLARFVIALQEGRLLGPAMMK